MPEFVDRATEAWNVAQGYTHLKILKPLVELDKLIRIALYGTENIEESIGMPPQIKAYFRIEAIHRIIDVLLELIENSEFIMDSKNKEHIAELRDKILVVQSVIDGVSDETFDQRTGDRKTKINEDHFNECMKSLRDVKKDLTYPLNRASLIFPSSDEIDLDKIKNELVYGG